MASLLRSLMGGGEERQTYPLAFQDYVNMFQFGNVPYMVNGGTQGQDGEKVEANFRGYVEGAYKSNGIVFACIQARMLLFAEARFQFQQMRFGRPGDLFGMEELEILERPWTGGTTGDLLSRMLQDADLGGNSFTVRRGNTLRRLRPDWMTIVTGTRTGSELDTELIGYMYEPGGPTSSEDPIVLMPDQVAHFAPTPDPTANYRGISWLTPVIEEICGDRSASAHKKNFFENGTKLGYVVTLDPEMVPNPDKFEKWVGKFRAGHEGELNAYKTLFLAGGDVKVVGSNLKDVDFKAVQGAGETRIAAAAGVHPVIVGLSEGLQGSSLNAGNYAAAHRRFVDGTMRPLWRNAAGSLERILDVPPAARLWYDDRDIPALRENEKDAAEIQQLQAITMRELINAGYEPESVVNAVTAGDYELLKHSGLVSVQLQPPGTTASAVSNGNGQPLLPESTS